MQSYLCVMCAPSAVELRSVHDPNMGLDHLFHCLHAVRCTVCQQLQSTVMHVFHLALKLHHVYCQYLMHKKVCAHGPCNVSAGTVATVRVIQLAGHVIYTYQ